MLPNVFSVPTGRRRFSFTISLAISIVPLGRLYLNRQPDTPCLANLRSRSATGTNLHHTSTGPRGTGIFSRVVEAGSGSRMNDAIIGAG